MDASGTAAGDESGGVSLTLGEPVLGMLVTHPLRPTSDWARARLASSTRAVITADLHKPRALDLLAAGEDRQGAGFLGCQSLLVSAGPSD